MGVFCTEVDCGTTLLLWDVLYCGMCGTEIGYATSRACTGCAVLIGYAATRAYGACLRSRGGEGEGRGAEGRRGGGKKGRRERVSECEESKTTSQVCTSGFMYWTSLRAHVS
eukprot:3877179-Rhodomonas_salina.2